MPQYRVEDRHDTMISFRPGESLGRILTRLAVDYEISRSAAARHMALLCFSDLPLEFYDEIVGVAAILGGPRGFEQACQHARGAVDGALLDRRSHDQLPMTIDERHQLILNALQLLRERMLNNEVIIQ